MRITATIATFLVGVFLGGALRVGLQGVSLGFIPGVMVGFLQLFFFFGMPWLVWRALAPKPVQNGSKVEEPL